MSLMSRIVNLLNNKPLENGMHLSIKAGGYSDEQPNAVLGKVIFAGGIGVSEDDKPRNVMGGNVIRAEMFKVILSGCNYCDLEGAHIKVKKTLKLEGYIQLSGFEHIEPKEGGAFQLAVTFKSVTQ